jgi:hypothetical protein
MATTKSKAETEAESTIPEGYEELFIPRARANEEINLFIGVNGVNYILPKGKRSTVPSFVADEYRRSLQAQDRLDEYIDQRTEQAKQAK